MPADIAVTDSVDEVFDLDIRETVSPNHEFSSADPLVIALENITEATCAVCTLSCRSCALSCEGTCSTCFTCSITC